MIFATCGFQSGALKYAETYNIATITFVNGNYLYETKSFGQSIPPPWVVVPKYAGIFMFYKDNGISCKTFDQKDTAILYTWLHLKQ